MLFNISRHSEDHSPAYPSETLNTYRKLSVCQNKAKIILYTANYYGYTDSIFFLCESMPFLKRFKSYVLIFLTPPPPAVKKRKTNMLQNIQVQPTTTTRDEGKNN